jgi:hypothetical protein
METIQLADDPAVQSLLRDLLRLGGNGRRMTERAAFLVIDSEGRYQCLLWPYHNGFAKEHFRGNVPPFTVAVAHTHPNSSPRPSDQDRREAVRLGLPFLVVSQNDIYTVTPGEGGDAISRVQLSGRSGRDEELLCQRLR